MMSFINRVRQYRVYRRLVLSYLLIILITITLLCSILYSLFSRSVVQEIEQSSQDMLSQVSYTANVVLKQVEDISYQLLNDNEIITFMYAHEEDKLVNYNANQLLSRVQSVYPFIFNISLYNFTTGSYIDVSGLTPDPGIRIDTPSKYLEFFPREVETIDNRQHNVLTFVMYPEQSFTGIAQSVIVLDIEESYIQNTMGMINSSSEDRSTFVMDAQGTILSHSSVPYFQQSFANVDYAQKILNSSETRGSYSYEIDGTNQLITFIKSEALDWYFVSIRPYDQLLKNLYELRFFVLLIGLLLFVVGVVISLLFTGNIYNPIRTLVDKVSERKPTGQGPILKQDEYHLLFEAFTSSMESAKTLESNLYRSAQIAKSSYLHHLLKGITHSTFRSTEIEYEWGSRLTGPFFTVMLVKIDCLQTFKDTQDLLNQGLIRFAIGNIAQEMLENVYVNDIAILDDEEIAIIIQSDSPKLDEGLYMTLTECQDVVKNYYNITISISIGHTCESLADIHSSYLSARATMEQRLFNGHGGIFDTMNNRELFASSLSYPTSQEKKLIESIKLCKPKQVEKEIQEWIRYISRCSYAQAIQYNSFLLLTIIRECQAVTDRCDAEDEEWYVSVDQIQEAETMDEVEQCLLDFCMRIVERSQDYNHNIAVVRSAKVIEDVKSFIQAHYSDPRLSLDFVSEQTKLSPGYIGKLFKSITGLSYNDYVSMIRLDKAKSLLAETTDTVAQIGEQVGIYNVSYFSTLFKKKYGITPSQYREQSQADR